jgi:6-phospho-3-hexuloisomerase
MIDLDTSLKKLHREVEASIQAIDSREVTSFVESLTNSGRVAFYGVGREGLMLKGFAMRLYHLGFKSGVVGDMTAFPVGSGDLLVVSAGPGHFSTVDALRQVAQKAGAKVFCFTAQKDSALARQSDGRLVIPAQTAADQDQGKSAVPMGSLYELALFSLLELVVAELFVQTRTEVHDAYLRHTNLE